MDKEFPIEWNNYQNNLLLYQNEELFNSDLELLPGVNFAELWKTDISDTTKSTIWKYLQLILFILIRFL